MKTCCSASHSVVALTVVDRTDSLRGGHGNFPTPGSPVGMKMNLGVRIEDAHDNQTHEQFPASRHQDHCPGDEECSASRDSDRRESTVVEGG